MKVKVDEFEKRGVKIDVLVRLDGIDRYTLFLRANGHEAYADISREQGVDGYR